MQFVVRIDPTRSSHDFFRLSVARNVSSRTAWDLPASGTKFPVAMNRELPRICFIVDADLPEEVLGSARKFNKFPAFFRASKELNCRNLFDRYEGN